MEKKNTGLIVLIIILSVLVVALSGYIVYDKVISNDKYKNNKENTIEIDDSLNSELINIFQFVYDYYRLLNPYCGDWSLEDEISNDSNSVPYFASTEFNSFDEMINNLKQYMTEQVIYGNHSMSRDYYIERDGKLYCPVSAKSGDYCQLDKVYIKYSRPLASTIETNIEVKSSCYDGSSDTSIQTVLYDVTFTQQNDTWIISSYAEQ